jgi:spore coat polysaccharide biosynthesis protein SpsF (cytidylyltransferase family)
MKNSFIAIIPAKEGSNRLKNKNLCKINGKTLIEHAIDFLRQSQYVNRIIVSTDSDTIEGICLGCNVEVMRRPSCMCGDVDVVDVYRFVIQQITNVPLSDKVYVIGVQPDNPDRTVRLDEMINFCIDHKYDDCVTVGVDGRRNGSIRIMDYTSLYNGKIGSTKVGTFLDDCTNIHLKHYIDGHASLSRLLPSINPLLLRYTIYLNYL